MEKLKYFISREFLFTILGLLGVGVILYLAIFFVILPLYTKHGSGITVPKVEERSYAEAQSILDDADLRPQVIDSVYVEGLPPGTVIKQYPAPYVRVKPNRLVSLTVNQDHPPFVQLPDIEDMILYQAKVRLEGVKLSVGKVTRVPHIGKDKVLKVSYEGNPIQPQTRVPMGAKIDVSIGLGRGSHRVHVPDLVGMSYEDAYILMQEIGVSLVPSYNSNGPDEYQGKIYTQSPKSGIGDSIHIGSSVSVSINSSEPESREGIIVEKE